MASRRCAAVLSTGRVPHVSSGIEADDPVPSGSGLLCSSWAREQTSIRSARPAAIAATCSSNGRFPGHGTWATIRRLHPWWRSSGAPGCACRGWCRFWRAGQAESSPTGGRPPEARDSSGAELVVDPGRGRCRGARRSSTSHRAPTRLTDVLVCTHGRRDRCCGSLGTALAQELLADPGQLGEGVRVWRTSHTGGHRFAATAVVLPQGTAWAFCDTEALVRIVHRRGRYPISCRVTGAVRGWPLAAVQALERAVLGEVGWPLLAMTRRGAELGDGRTELVVEDPGGEPGGMGSDRAASGGRCPRPVAVWRWSLRPRPSRSWSSPTCAAVRDAAKGKVRYRPSARNAAARVLRLTGVPLSVRVRRS